MVFDPRFTLERGMSTALNVPAQMTLEEFLTWDARGPGHWLLLDGVRWAMTPAGSTHGVIQSNIATAIINHLDQRGGPCVMITHPGIIPAFRSNRNFFVPDAAVTCSETDIGVPGIRHPVLVDRDSVALEPRRNMAEHPGLYVDPERAGNPGRPHRFRQRRVTAARR